MIICLFAELSNCVLIKCPHGSRGFFVLSKFGEQMDCGSPLRYSDAFIAAEEDVSGQQ